MKTKTLTTEAEWKSANLRRLLLIRKKVLSRREGAELRQLTKATDQYLERVTVPLKDPLTVAAR